MSEIYYLNVTLHVLAAFLWIGGMLFLAIVGAPVLREVDPRVRAEIFQLLGTRFRRVGWIAILILLATGVLNLHLRGLLHLQLLGDPDFWASPFGTTLGWKLTAVAAMLVVSGVHDFVLGPGAARMEPGDPQSVVARRRAALFARVNAGIGVLIVFLAVRLARGG